jgi:hypothetical protein
VYGVVFLVATGVESHRRLQGNSTEVGLGVGEEGVDAGGRNRLRVASSSTSEQQQLWGGSGSSDRAAAVAASTVATSSSEEGRGDETLCRML